MTESSFTQRAADLANKAADAAGPLIVKARAVAGDLYVKAEPYVGKAAGVASQQVTVAADQLNKATKGKYADKITSVRSRIATTLDKPTQ